MAIDNNISARVAAKVAGKRGLTALTHVSTNDSACVFRAEADDGPVAIKVHAETVAWASETEVLALLRGTGAAVPQLRTIERIGPFDAIVMSWLPGRPLLETWGGLSITQRQSALGVAGELLGAVHRAINADALARAHFWRHQSGRFRSFSWPRSISKQIARWHERIVINEEDRRLGLPARLVAIEEAARRLPPLEVPALLHRDFSLRNIMSIGDQPIAIVDFASAALGDPVYDLAKLPWLNLAANDIAGRDALLAGWESGAGTRIDRERYAFYTAVQALAAIGWADRRGGNNEFRALARQALLDYGGILTGS